MVTLAEGSGADISNPIKPILTLRRSGNRFARLTARVGAKGLNLLDEVLAGDDLTEDDVLAVEPRGDDGGDEELGAVGVGSGVGHREEEGAVVAELEVLVGELVAVDGLRGWRQREAFDANRARDVR